MPLSVFLQWSVGVCVLAVKCRCLCAFSEVSGCCLCACNEVSGVCVLAVKCGGVVCVLAVKCRAFVCLQWGVGCCLCACREVSGLVYVRSVKRRVLSKILQRSVGSCLRSCSEVSGLVKCKCVQWNASGCLCAYSALIHHADCQRVPLLADHTQLILHGPPQVGSGLPGRVFRDRKPQCRLCAHGQAYFR